MEGSMTEASYVANGLTERVINALHKGPIRSIGGMVFDSSMKLLCSTTELYLISRQPLPNNGVITRIDSGGSPTWELHNDYYETT